MSSPDKSWKRSLLRRLKSWAEERFPVTFPVRVYLRPESKMTGHLGYFEHDEEGERGIISIADSQDRYGIVDTFVEEWAHARTIFLVDLEDHDADPWHHPSFWAEYGRIQQASRSIPW